jgi:hypothetical protein
VHDGADARATTLEQIDAYATAASTLPQR